MTELTITPKVQDKTARFKGTIAAGEHVAVTIKGGAGWIGEDDGANLTLRVIDLTTKRTLAVFPRPAETLEENETADAWDSSGGDLTCTLNLNTLRMVNAARHMIRVPVMFVLGDTDAPRTLYFCDQYTVEYWPERIGDDVPYDLDKWPKKIDDWTVLVAEWGEQMTAFGTALSGHTGNGDIHVTAEQKASWTAKQNAINDLEMIRAGASKGATAIQSHQDISGKADLVGGKVPSSQLPSYVDDVLEYASLSAFPAAGEEGKIYVAKDENKTYRWSGTQYVQVGGSDIAVDSALSTTSTNPVQNKVVTEAVNARPTKAEVESGWWSGWTFDGVPATTGTHYELLKDISGDYYYLYAIPDGHTADEWDIQELQEFYIGQGAGDSDIIAITIEGVTATRHRVAAPVPTKTSDLTNDSGFLTQHQQLTPVYSQTSPFGEWSFSPQANITLVYTDDPTLGWVASSSEWGDWVNVLAPEDATELSFTGWDGINYTATRTRTRTDVIGYVLGTQTDKPLQPKGNYLTQHQSLAGLMPMYPMVTATVASGTLTVSPYTSATYTATSTAAAFEIAVGALPTGVTGKVRDCILVIDCTATEAVAPTVTWDTHFHPRTDTETDLAIVEAGKRAVFYISEYAPGEFAVGGWQVTEGGYTPNGGSGT